MSASDQSGILHYDIGQLYMSKSFSDVTIVIDGTELPAHRMILSQRCPHLYAFTIPMIESTSTRIELYETPIDGFQLVLKWIYTGEIKFSQIETAVEVQWLSNIYLLTELEMLATNCVEEFNGTSSEMPISDQSGVAQLAIEIGRLYLNENFSDVTIVVDGVELPAHRMILSQRSSYFKAMFASGMIESRSRRIELHETPINTFKLALKWIYTGEIEFTQIETAIEVIHLSDMYLFKYLEELAGEHVTDNCSFDNVCLVLNNIALLPDHQLDWIDTPLEEHSHIFLAHETFLTLSKGGLSTLLKSELVEITNAEILKASVRWMRANPDQSEHFFDLLKLISLNSISLGELVSIVPSDLISGNMLIEAALEQQVMYENGRVINTNFAVLKYGAKINIAGRNLFFPKRFVSAADKAGDESEEVVIDLGQRFKVNTFYAERSMNYTETSYIEISVSTDEAKWTCVVDQTSVDVSWNKYKVEDCVIRFVRISGDRPLNEILELDFFMVCYEV